MEDRYCKFPPSLVNSGLMQRLENTTSVGTKSLEGFQGKQTQQVISLRLCAHEDSRTCLHFRVSAAGTHVHCHLAAAATVMNPRTLPSEKILFIERRELALSRRGMEKESLPPAAFFFFKRPFFSLV